MNKHGDHDATCLCCKHLYISYSPGYSSWTPSDGPDPVCNQGHELGRSPKCYPPEYGVYMQDLFPAGASWCDKALHCPDFLSRED